MLYFKKYASPIGVITMMSTQDKLVGLWIEGQKYFQEGIQDTLIENNAFPLLLQVENWLQHYFQGENPSVKELPLEPKGSPFQKLVWSLLLEIPYGKTTTYKELAKQVAVQMKKEKMSAQAIGGAVSHNPISIIIPCHRVVGSNQSLVGYAGGISRKKKLLLLENADVSNEH